MSSGRLGQAVLCAGCFPGAALSADAQMNWTMTTPTANQDFAQTEDVAGSGNAPGAGSTAEFIFWQDDPSTGGLIVRGVNPVTAVAQPGGLLGGMWDDILDPAVEQPATGKWPLSAAGERDYHTEIKPTGGIGAVAVSDQKVEP